MDEKMLGVLRHILTAVGAFAVFSGWTDDATWATMSGSLAVLISVIWSWMSKMDPNA